MKLRVLSLRIWALLVAVLGFVLLLAEIALLKLADQPHLNPGPLGGWLLIITDFAIAAAILKAFGIAYPWTPHVGSKLAASGPDLRKSDRKLITAFGVLALVLVVPSAIYFELNNPDSGNLLLTFAMVFVAAIILVVIRRPKKTRGTGAELNSAGSMGDFRSDVGAEPGYELTWACAGSARRTTNGC